jgi:hypothetical protein
MVVLLGVAVALLATGVAIAAGSWNLVGTL